MSRSEFFEMDLEELQAYIKRAEVYAKDLKGVD